MDIETGISIIMNNWVRLRRDEVLHFITDENHLAEANAIERWADSYGAVLKITIVPADDVQSGEIIEQMAYYMAYADVIIGATDHSFITTDAVKNATSGSARFLSLPLSCSDGTSLLEQDFIAMDTRWTAKASKHLLGYLNKSDSIRITTEKGTDLTFSKKGRQAGFFNGVVAHRGAISSASFETYIPIVEDSTDGILYLDASLGYLGKIEEPFFVSFSKGRLYCESDSPDAVKLNKYIDSFGDPTMRMNGELGIGLNPLSRCRGISYIEDESTYGTFHIGMGRNIALGGNQHAEGHFDVITYRPNIYIGNALVMKDGRLVF